MTKESQPSRFKSLLDKRKQVDAGVTLGGIEAEGEEEKQGQDMGAVTQAAIEAVPKSGTGQRRLGRPRGRRSDPDYTQISAYIPLDLLLDIQDELAKEKRRLRQRSAATVSELYSNRLRNGLF